MEEEYKGQMYVDGDFDTIVKTIKDFLKQLETGEFK
jgi:hypothetical protein